MIIAVLIAFFFGVGVGALLQSHLAHHAALRRRAQEQELENRRRDAD